MHFPSTIIMPRSDYSGLVLHNLCMNSITSTDWHHILLPSNINDSSPADYYLFPKLEWSCYRTDPISCCCSTGNLCIMCPCVAKGSTMAPEPATIITWSIGERRRRRMQLCGFDHFRESRPSRLASQPASQSRLSHSPIDMSPKWSQSVHHLSVRVPKPQQRGGNYATDNGSDSLGPRARGQVVPPSSSSLQSS